VLVDGEIVFRDGEFAHMKDSTRVVTEGERIARAILEKAGLSARLTPAWRM
jgi:hypothetical protein